MSGVPLLASRPVARQKGAFSFTGHVPNADGSIDACADIATALLDPFNSSGYTVAFFEDAPCAVSQGTFTAPRLAMFAEARSGPARRAGAQPALCCACLWCLPHFDCTLRRGGGNGAGKHRCGR